MNRRSTLKTRRRCGAMLVQIAIMMIGFMLAIAFSIDSAQMQLTQTEMHTATEAAAKAIAGTLADTQDSELAIARGQQLAAANRVNGMPLVLNQSDIQFGRSSELSSGRLEFEPAEFPYNSVSVRGHHNFETPEAQTPLIFSRIFGAAVFEPSSIATAIFVERDIVLVVDRSDAMSDEDFKALHNAIEIFSSALAATPSDERVGLASYGRQATAEVALTEQLSEITAAVECLDNGGPANVAEGLLAGEKLLRQSHQRSWIQRTLIVMSNGVSTIGTDPKVVAAALGADGIQVFTVTFGSETDQDEMKRMAELGNGRYFHAEHESDLEQVYSEIAKTLSTMMSQSIADTPVGR
ncbi:MAG: VWA domain-containing protein [Rubripirellula sp.]|nr:VWA domain-containing protein [Rubripirellula sp.]